MKATRRPKVLIVNAYVDPWRSAAPMRLFIPRAMAPYYLAGRFSPKQVDVRVYDEVHHGAMLNPRQFDWPDLVIFTGLTAAFDRARQLSAYFRNANPSVCTVIGGPIARAFPKTCAGVFDHVCQDDVEALDGLVEDVLGADYLAVDPAPRFDLAGWSFGLGFVETTKNCNFSCSFCSLTGEGRAYLPYSTQEISRQLDTAGRRSMLMVLDNNFYGNNRADFERRVDLLGERWRRGDFRGWGALVTGDFFKNPKNLAKVSANGCKALFSGVESLDPEVLRNYNKRHSLSSDPRSLARLCAEHGVLFDYGMMLDFGRQTIDEVDSQIDAVLESIETPLPALLSLTIPIPGTPHFEETVRAGRLMPNLRLSDLDGQKLVEWPKEPVERVVPFLADLLRFRGRKTALARHAIRHAWSRRNAFDHLQTAISMLGPLVRFGGGLRIGSVRQMHRTWQEPKRTFCAMSDPLSVAYRPSHRLDTKFAPDFEPLYLTDAEGHPTADVEMHMSQSRGSGAFAAIEATTGSAATN
ncbi:radical SAM protein [uncultured Roseibium sp.]|uniref:B12-binding domain-containing radical SAM protein n=1 Tax=uncultured Roseibium sp. TaxID=1936171 RepID=UPI002618BC27|nr:radical SAM protein [uncultured Roseibium sp.]